MGTVGDGGSLLDLQFPAEVFQIVAVELTPVIRAQLAWGPEGTDEIFERPDDTGRGFVAQLVALDEPGKHVFEDEDMFEAKALDWEGDQVAHHVVENTAGNDWLERSERLWHLLAELVADAAVGDEVAYILGKGWPIGKALDHRDQLLRLGVARPFRAMHVL